MVEFIRYYQTFILNCGRMLDVQGKHTQRDMFKNVNLNTNAKLISGKRRKGTTRHEEESEIEGKWGGGEGGTADTISLCQLTNVNSEVCSTSSPT